MRNIRQSIGRYLVTGTLGEGGMGIVYSAYDDRLGRPVAIKMIKAAVAEPAGRDRLEREARAAASVNHPSICQLYEIGEDEGELYLAMELLAGESLAARIARSVVPVSEAASIALGILTGLDALHTNGLVHRDLKPSNVFLTPNGIKLLDFGLTCAAQELTDETQTRVTTPGTVVGTPQYAAPEQLRGGPIDRRTDLFSTGVVLYEMLAGKPPFAGRTAVEVFHAIAYEQPPMLTGGSAVAAIDRIVHRALMKSPPERYQSATAMAEDLRASVVSSDTTTTVTPVRPMTRLIVLPFRVLRPDAETDFLAFSLADAVTSGLSGLQSLVVRSSLAAAHLASDVPDLQEIAAKAEVDAVLVGTLLRAGDQIRVSTQLLEAPAATVLWSHTAQRPVGDLFSLQDELTLKIVESLSVPLSTRERRMLKQDVPGSPRVYESWLRANELSRETTEWRAALELYERCVEEDPHYAPAWAGLGRMRRLVGKYQEPDVEDYFKGAEAALKRALALNPDLSAAENTYAHLEVDLGRAEEAMVRLIRLSRQRSADPELFAALVTACRYCGLLTASLAAAEQARRLDPRVRTTVAHTYFMLGDYQRVIDYEIESVPFMRSLALCMMGRQEEALKVIDAVDISNPSPLATYMRGVRQTVTRDPAAFDTMRSLRIGDPEGRFYLARQTAFLGDREGALVLLKQIVEDGFFCLPGIRRDPWLDSLRGTPEFDAILHRAEARHRQAVISFLTAEGDRVLGVAHPAT